MSSAPSDHSLISNYFFQQQWCWQKQPLPPAHCHVFLPFRPPSQPLTQQPHSQIDQGKKLWIKRKKRCFWTQCSSRCSSPRAPQTVVLVRLRGWQGAAYASTVLSGNTCQISPSGSNCVCTKASEKSSPPVPGLLDLGLGIWIRKGSLGVSSSLPRSCRQEPAQQIQAVPSLGCSKAALRWTVHSLKLKWVCKLGQKESSWGFPCLRISWINSDKAL